MRKRPKCHLRAMKLAVAIAPLAIGLGTSCSPRAEQQGSIKADRPSSSVGTGVFDKAQFLAFYNASKSFHLKQNQLMREIPPPKQGDQGTSDLPVPVSDNDHQTLQQLEEESLRYRVPSEDLLIEILGTDLFEPSTTFFSTVSDWLTIGFFQKLKIGGNKLPLKLKIKPREGEALTAQLVLALPRRENHPVEGYNVEEALASLEINPPSEFSELFRPNGESREAASQVVEVETLPATLQRLKDFLEKEKLLDD